MHLLNEPLILSIHFKLKCCLLYQNFDSIKLSCGILNVSCAVESQSAWEHESQSTQKEKTPFLQHSLVFCFYSPKRLIFIDVSYGETLNYACFNKFINQKYIKKILLMPRFGNYFRVHQGDTGYFEHITIQKTRTDTLLQLDLLEVLENSSYRNTNCSQNHCLYYIMSTTVSCHKLYTYTHKVYCCHKFTSTHIYKSTNLPFHLKKK